MRMTIFLFTSATKSVKRSDTATLRICRFVETTVKIAGQHSCRPSLAHKSPKRLTTEREMPAAQRVSLLAGDPDPHAQRVAGGFHRGKNQSLLAVVNSPHNANTHSHNGTTRVALTISTPSPGPLPNVTVPTGRARHLPQPARSQLHHNGHLKHDSHLG